MSKLFKVSLSIIFFFVIVAFVIPFFIDKQKFVKLATEKINSELKGNISFDQDIVLTFLPFPSLKINSLRYSDNKLHLQTKKVKISVTWSSIFDLKPEITNMEILSPILKVQDDPILTQNKNLKIFVNNKKEYFYDKIKRLSNKFEIIKIKEGQVKFEKVTNLNFDNFNAIVKGKDRLSMNGNLNFKKLDSKVIFDFFQVKDNKFDLIMQKKINDKNKLDFTGQINLIENDFQLSGEIKSDFLNLEEILQINKQLVSFRNNDFIYSGSEKKNKKKIHFKIKKLLVSNALLENTKFSLIYQYPFFEIENFDASFHDAKISGVSRVNIGINKVNGNLSLKNFYVKESYLGKTKYDLLDGKANCKLTFDYFIGKNQNNWKSFVSNGNCKTGKIKLKGLDISKVANDVDNIKDFASLVNTINPKVLQGSSEIKFIEFNFSVKNGKFKVENSKALHKNVELISFGSIDLINNDINLKNKAYFKTPKFSKLPPLGIDILGKINQYNIKYNFEDLKQELFNKGIKKILKEKKSIIIDPNEIKKMFNSESFDPGSILDLFEN